jgi:hypothetical protein
MSLLDDDRPTNPAQHFIKVKNGALSYYDKEAGENVEVPTPLKFIVLDQFGTVKGWSDADESGFWSNEVKRIGSDTVNVRTKAGLKASGVWKDIKGKPELAGAKYNSSIYIAAPGRDGLEIQNLAFTGAALNAWIEFTKANDVRKNSVTLSEWADAKKGSVKYKVPVFTAAPMEDGEKEEAVELAKQLREYHNEYFSNNHTEEAQPDGGKDVVIEDIDEDEPINLDDIPF